MNKQSHLIPAHLIPLYAASMNFCSGYWEEDSCCNGLMVAKLKQICPTNFSVVVFTQSEPIVYRYIRIILHRTDNTLDSTFSIIAIAESNLLVYNL